MVRATCTTFASHTVVPFTGSVAISGGSSGAGSARGSSVCQMAETNEDSLGRVEAAGSGGGMCCSLICSGGGSCGSFRQEYLSRSLFFLSASANHWWGGTWMPPIALLSWILLNSCSELCLAFDARAAWASTVCISEARASPVRFICFILLARSWMAALKDSTLLLAACLCFPPLSSSPLGSFPATESFAFTLLLSSAVTLSAPASPASSIGPPASPPTCFTTALSISASRTNG
mmetsp:Transcript_13948/g.39493  ORF Transcript_13948/g.39493 Transcript_13948/m.39493 type:complete len:234 (-) Transcript_13948:204-905(-)